MSFWRGGRVTLERLSHFDRKNSTPFLISELRNSDRRMHPATGNWIGGRKRKNRLSNEEREDH